MLAAYALGACRGLEPWGAGNAAWRARRTDIQPQTVRQIAQELRQASAYSAYQRLHTLGAHGAPGHAGLVYTFIGLSVTELFTAMLWRARPRWSREKWWISFWVRLKGPVHQTLLTGLFLGYMGCFCSPP